jgi:hypothetical protein
MYSLRWDQVHAWRLAQHNLLERADRSKMLDVLGKIGYAHAQVMSSGELQLGARVDGISPGEVQQALWKDRSLVKTWTLRGTLHLVRVEDFPNVIATLDTYVAPWYRRAPWLKFHGITQAEQDAINDAIGDTLTDTPMTREQLADGIARRTGSNHLRELLLSGWGGLLKPAAMRGDLCFGPSQGQNVTFVRPARWIGEWKPADPERASQEMARRFWGAFGPATLNEFKRWYGMQPRPAKEIFKTLEDELEQVDIGGSKAWALVSTLKEIEKCEAIDAVRLLPGFDPYTIGVHPHLESVLPEQYKALVYRQAGWVSSVVLLGGRMVGVWEYEKKRSQIEVKVTLFDPPTKKLKKGIEAEAERIGSFINGNVQLTSA